MVRAAIMSPSCAHTDAFPSVVDGEMQEFLVQFNNMMVISVPRGTESPLSLVKEEISKREHIPSSRLDILRNGRPLVDDIGSCASKEPIMLQARLTQGLCGGKGGFGGMLRSQGKGAGAKVTTDFGACRDLHGRRLRHVNQEVAMHKWREEAPIREQQRQQHLSEQEIPEEETPSGIPGWYLSTPSWTESIKKSRIKRRRKTQLCRHWQSAREGGVVPPPNAPKWWGCPRGRICEFAHGEDELRGEALTEHKRQKKAKKEQEANAQKQKYVDYEQDVPDDIQSAIQEGLQRKLKQTTESEGKVEVKSTNVSLDGAEWLTALGGQVGTTFKHSLCELRGKSNFGTAVGVSCRLSKGKWYYEVKLVTSGIVQIGWAGASFTANSDDGDGVGDHAQSWAYDGCRQLKWNNGTEQSYGKAWEKGDVVGCLLDTDSGEIRFSLNGEWMEAAFTGLKIEEEMIPAISLEPTEIVLVNIGGQELSQLPEGYQAVAHAYVLPANATVPVVETAETKAEETKTEESKTEEEPVKSDEAVEEKVEPIDLSNVTSAKELETYGLNRLKQELQMRGLKCGGKLDERATRLLSVKGKAWEEIPNRLKDPKSHRRS